MRLRNCVAVLALALLLVVGASPASAAQQSMTGAQLAAAMKPITTIFSAADSGNFKLLHAEYAPSGADLDEGSRILQSLLRRR